MLESTHIILARLYCNMAPSLIDSAANMIEPLPKNVPHKSVYVELDDFKSFTDKEDQKSVAVARGLVLDCCQQWGIGHGGKSQNFFFYLLPCNPRIYPTDFYENGQEVDLVWRLLPMHCGGMSCDTIHCIQIGSTETASFYQMDMSQSSNISCFILPDTRNGQWSSSRAIAIQPLSTLLI